MFRTSRNILPTGVSNQSMSLSIFLINNSGCATLRIQPMTRRGAVAVGRGNTSERFKFETINIPLAHE